jgi:hypothetical protein
MNKKGMEMETVVKMILTIISFIIIFFVMSVLLIPTMNDSYKDAVCKFSLYMASYSRGGIPFIGVKTGSVFKLNCPMHERKISSPDKEETMKTIAKESASCWSKLGDGNVDFYSDINWPWDQGTVFCVICSRIEPKSTSYDQLINNDDYIKFLAETTYPKEKLTYLEYLAGGKDKTLPSFVEMESSSITVTKENPLYIIFAVDKSEGVGEKFARAFGIENEDIISLAAALKVKGIASSSGTKASGAVDATGDIKALREKADNLLTKIKKMPEYSAERTAARAEFDGLLTRIGTLMEASPAEAGIGTKAIKGISKFTIKPVSKIGGKALKVLPYVGTAFIIIDVSSSIFVSKNFNAKILYLNSEQAAGVCDELI